jgi:hypothetical protein
MNALDTMFIYALQRQPDGTWVPLIVSTSRLDLLLGRGKIMLTTLSPINSNE